MIVDVDCTAEGSGTCQKVGVQGYPTIKYYPAGDKKGKDYQGGRDYDSLKSFVVKTLDKPVCDAATKKGCAKNEIEFLKKMDGKSKAELHQRVIGQEAAVTSVAEAVQRSRADLADPNGPVASFMFLGPTGVGKTELAKALANYLFNSDTALVRLDMSEYMEKHSVARLIGAPPGYVGYDEGGMLTDAVRQKPYSVVLFDEIEKAHVDVFNVLLQLLDEGHVTDTQGRNVSFRNCLIIMTSNLGSDEISYANKRRNKVNVKDAVMQHVRSHFRPEFVNRLDEFIVFEPLTHAQIEEIVQLQTKKLSERIDNQRMNLSLDRSAIEHLARQGYDPAYGARPVRRAIQRELIQPLANAMLRGVFNEDDTILVTADRQGICLSNGPKIVREVFDIHAQDSEDESDNL